MVPDFEGTSIGNGGRPRYLADFTGKSLDVVAEDCDRHSNESNAFCTVRLNSHIFKHTSGRGSLLFESRVPRTEVPDASFACVDLGERFG